MRILIVALCVCLVGLAGCAKNRAYGNKSLESESREGVESKIEIGKSTRDEVRARYGEPVKKDLTEGGGEIWRYAHLSGSVRGVTFVPIVGSMKGGVDRRARELQVLFSRDGVVEKILFSDETRFISPDAARQEVGALPVAR